MIYPSIQEIVKLLIPTSESLVIQMRQVYKGLIASSSLCQVFLKHCQILVCTIH